MFKYQTCCVNGSNNYTVSTFQPFLIWKMGKIAIAWYSYHVESDILNTVRQDVAVMIVDIGSVWLLVFTDASYIARVNIERVTLPTFYLYCALSWRAAPSRRTPRVSLSEPLTTSCTLPVISGVAVRLQVKWSGGIKTSTVLFFFILILLHIDF